MQLKPKYAEKVDDIFQCMSQGQVCCFKNNLLLKTEITPARIDGLLSKRGDLKVLTGKPSAVSIDAVPLDHFWEHVKTTTGTFPDWRSSKCTAQEPKYSRGVMNARRLSNDVFDYANAFRKWLRVSFLWIGPSPGALHYDVIDNFLCQLHGKKDVLIYPPHAVCQVDGHNTPRSVQPSNFLSKESLQRSPWMKNLDYFEISLEPGDAVYIPAFAYHAPLARSTDSVSLNGFLYPKWFTGPHPALILTSYYFGFLKQFYFLFFLNRLRNYLGLKSVLIGPYEFV